MLLSILKWRNENTLFFQKTLIFRTLLLTQIPLKGKVRVTSTQYTVGNIWFYKHLMFLVGVKSCFYAF